MIIRLTRNTIVDGAARAAGEVCETDMRTGWLLVAMGKALELTEKPEQAETTDARPARIETTHRTRK